MPGKVADFLRASDPDTFFAEVGSGPHKPSRRREAIAEYVRLMVKHRSLLAFVSKNSLSAVVCDTSNTAQA